MKIAIAAFYKFVPLGDAPVLQQSIRARCMEMGIRGTVLLAQEGINATVSGARDAMNGFLNWLQADARFNDLSIKTSFADEHPFKRLKVKIKPEIVTFGVPEADPSSRVGSYVKAEDWNALIQQEGVTLIDTRNDYEVAIGTFNGAIDPGTAAFGDFPEYVAKNLDPAKHKKIAMFCTGGIRCEKASSYLLGLGFPEVYHLEGGILKYLEDVPEAESLWRGECYIFDQRVALRHGVTPGSHENCASCGYPVTASRELVACPNCGGSTPKRG